MEKGIIKSLNREKGHGFIRREKGEDVFVNLSGIQPIELHKLTEGQSVKFDVVKGREGWQAKNMEPLGNQPGVFDLLMTKLEELFAQRKPVSPEDTKEFKEMLASVSVSRELSRFLVPNSMETIQKSDAEMKIAPDRNVLSDICKMLGIKILLRSETDLVRLVEEQLPVSTISALVKYGFQEKEICSVVLPRRTLQHRRARKEKLTREESDRAVRLARLVALTERVFGDAEASMDWLRAPKMRYGGRAPIELMATETGARLVEEMLHQIDQGLAA